MSVLWRAPGKTGTQIGRLTQIRLRNVNPPTYFLESDHAPQPKSQTHCSGNTISLSGSASHSAADHLYPAPVEGVSIALILSVKLIPLLALVMLVFRGNNRGYIWLAFVVIFYFTQAVVSAWLSQGAPGPVILVVLTFLLFTMAMVHLKVNRPITG